MKLILSVACTLAASAVLPLAAMPTQDETERAEPLVKKLMASERAALESGTMTRGEVAAAAMKLARESDSEAAKLLLMKGAFALHVKDGNFEQAVRTINALEAAIADMPPQSITNMIETALLGVNKEDGHRLYRLLDEAKKNVAVRSGSSMRSVERNTIASILRGMIKVPGRDYWLSETELTQGQWEAVMGYNPSLNRGVDLPVENVSMDNCDVFLEKLNQAAEVKNSQFEFRLPTYSEWGYAAQAGASGDECWVKDGIVGNILDMAWVKDNSSNQTHAVATKTPNAFGFYDMLGNVWELMSGRDNNGNLRIRGRSINYGVDIGWGWFIGRYVYFSNSNHRSNEIGLRVAAHIRNPTVAPRVTNEPSDSVKERNTIASILRGMIKVPGRDYWLSETELTQGQWEAVMGCNYSKHKGANFPVENVSRDECDEFLGKLNQTKEVQASLFEFCMPSLSEWKYAAQAGGPGADCWIGRGVAGNVTDMAWVKENSGGQTHAVATKAANAWGFYDMLGNVWEWMVGENLTVGCRHGCSFDEPAVECSPAKGLHTARNLRDDHCGLRLAARVRPAEKNEGNQEDSIIDRLKTNSK